MTFADDNQERFGLFDDALTPDQIRDIEDRLDTPKAARNARLMAEAWKSGGKEGLRKKMREMFPSETAAQHQLRLPRHLLKQGGVLPDPEESGPSGDSPQQRS